MEARSWPEDAKTARQILENSIREGLRDVLGPDGTELVSRLRPIDLAAEDPRSLHDLLVSVFNAKGALVIERRIAHRLLESLGDKPGADEPRRQSVQEHSPGKIDGDKIVERQAKLLRRFADVAKLPGGASRRRQTHGNSGKGAIESMDSTARSFAEAFTSGR